MAEDSSLNEVATPILTKQEPKKRASSLKIIFICLAVIILILVITGL